MIINLAVVNAANNEINLHYNERPPYLITVNNELTGLTSATAIAVFQKAKVPYNLTITPTARQMDLIKTNLSSDCAIGWFKNPDRESFAKFTLPIYQDRPQIALTQKKNKKIGADPRSVQSLLANKNLLILVKKGYSYGAFFDELIDKYHPTNMATVAKNTVMIRQIEESRADYMLISPEEAD